jgi:glycosyltransferase involved in cell wall biosynthesis
MRIAQISPLIESVPPKAYGGTERVVAHLTEQLVQAGHDVTLFASGDSQTSAKLVPVCERALRGDGQVRDPMPDHVLQTEMVFRQADHFDILHFHTDFYHFPLARRSKTPSVTTFHGRLDMPELIGITREFKDLPVVSISNNQREPLPWMNWVATVPHGLPLELYPFRPNPRGHLAFLGRMSPEKGADRAIEIATRVGLPLKLAAKVDPADREYFDSQIKPMLDHDQVEFVGEINDQQKGEFLGKAAALLFPIDWPEPFGLVMIESLACGTPVVAFDRGDVREVMEDDVTGYVVNSIDEAVTATRRAVALDRRRCRDVFERRFSAQRMAADYTRVYEQLVARHGA